MLSTQQLIETGRSELFCNHNVKKLDDVLWQYQCKVDGLLSFASIWLPPVPGTRKQNEKIFVKKIMIMAKPQDKTFRIHYYVFVSQKFVFVELRNLCSVFPAQTKRFTPEEP